MISGANSSVPGGLYIQVPLSSLASSNDADPRFILQIIDGPRFFEAVTLHPQEAGTPKLALTPHALGTVVAPLLNRRLESEEVTPRALLLKSDKSSPRETLKPEKLGRGWLPVFFRRLGSARCGFFPLSELPTGNPPSAEFVIIGRRKSELW